MTSSVDDRLYRLLPAVYRMRDAERGGPLQALLAVMESQLAQIRDDVANLYDNWFVETCDEWVVPYIGDLLGIRSQYVFDSDALSLRPFVANTLRYRRRKGTAAMLEGLARDVTGWPARSIEMFPLLATTQHLNHIRAIDKRTPDLRDTNALELLGGPFETTMHFADVRRISSARGKYNIGNVAIFVWRLVAMPIELAPAVAAGGGRFRFSQLGADMRLFNGARTELAGRVSEDDMPGPLRARAVYEETEAARAMLGAGEQPVFRYLDDQPAFAVYADGVRIPPEEVQICDLSDWAMLPPAKTVSLPTDPPTTLTTRVAVDPVLGRFAYVSGAVPAATHVSYHVGFAAEIGGGAYARRDAAAPPANAVTFAVDVLDPSQPVDDGFVDALDAWEAAGRPDAVFELRGADLFPEGRGSGIFRVRDFEVPAGGQVLIRAADGGRPVLAPAAPWTITLAGHARLICSGLVVAGDVTRFAPVGVDDDHTVAIEDCTFVPGQRLDESGAPVAPAAPSLASAPAASGALILSIARAVTGRIDLTAGAADFGARLSIADSIVDGTDDPAPALATRGDAVIVRTTIFGATQTGTLEASEVIFDEPVAVTRTQLGCVRFSYVPLGSTTPRAYRCQPALALSAAAGDAEQSAIEARLLPSYTSRRFTDPGYAQLANDCPVEIARGAEAEREMGAFRRLMQPQRLANLKTSLDEYLRFGLEAGVFLVT